MEDIGGDNERTVSTILLVLVVCSHAVIPKEKQKKTVAKNKTKKKQSDILKKFHSDWTWTYRFLPESPRWLLAKGRLAEANEILKTLALVNGKELPESFTQRLKQRMTMSRTKSEEERLRNGPGVLSLFKTPNMRLKTCLITLNWWVNTFAALYRFNLEYRYAAQSALPV